jgi:M6 family metalloprotease-like protein
LFLLPLLLATIFAGNALGVPALPIIHILSQPDGSEFKARQWGDEWNSGFETIEGYTIIKNSATEVWEYAVPDGEGGLASSGDAVYANEVPVDIQLHVRPEQSESPKMSPDAEEAPDEVVPPTGTANIPVLLGTFSDTNPVYTTTDFNALLFGTGTNSMKDYYQEVSYGKFSVSPGPAGVKGWYRASGTHEYYGAPSGTSKDAHRGEFAKEIVAAADASVNFAPYDSDGDCYVDTVVIVHQGTGQEASGVANDIWSHSWSLSGAGVGEYTTNDTASCGAIKVNRYVMQPEKYGTGMTTVGVFAHEFGHALGLPDLYDTDDSSEGIGKWGLMAGGSWNYVSISGDRPAHLSAWSKYKLGWVTPAVVSGTKTNEAISASCNQADVYRFSTSTATEYFLLENRQRCGFDAGLPGAGLAIWHVDETKSTNREECKTATGCASLHYKVALEQADGLFDLENNRNRGDSGDLYVSGKVFTSTSTPNSLAYGGTNNNISVTNISGSASEMTATLATVSPVCTVYAALPVRVTMYPSGTAYVYFRPHLWWNGSAMSYNTVPALGSYYWYGKVSTSTPAGAALAVSYADAIMNQTKVYVKGNAACLSAGASGYIGTIDPFVINP